MNPSATVSHIDAKREQLLQRFVQEAQAIAATVERVERSASAIVAAVAKVSAGSNRIVVGEPKDIPRELFELCRALPGVITGQSRHDLRDHSFEAIEYLAGILRSSGRLPAEAFPASRCAQGRRIFYHSHCQQRTINAAAPTVDLLRACGFDVVTSTVECCGMAGSSGYKKAFYELSIAVGEDLTRQIALAEKDGPRILVASGPPARSRYTECWAAR